MSYWKPDNAHVDECLSRLMQKWNDAKGWSFQPNRSFGKRFWRVMDHHEWEHVEQVVDDYIDQAQTPLYLLKVLETPARYTRIELDAERERWTQERSGLTIDDDINPRLNPFLSGSVTKSSSEPTKLVDVDTPNLFGTNDKTT